MKLDEFTLAATINDLTRESEARRSADIVEFRMDRAEDPLEQLSEYDGSLPILATNRGKWFGGEADDSGRLDRLSAASRHESVKFVDVELETARGKSWILDELRDNGVHLIISHHDFEVTPYEGVLDAIFEQCSEYGDVGKVAIFPQNQEDVVRLLKAVNAATKRGRNVAGIAMGELGSQTRVVGPLYGSKLGYAPLASDTSKYAPGQIPLEELTSRIEAAMKERRREDGGVIGDSVDRVRKHEEFVRVD